MRSLQVICQLWHFCFPALGWFLASASLGAADPSDICDAAARSAAQQTGVPVSVLYAISRTETGRGSGNDLRPWPWTVNVEGEGRWFDSRSEALQWALERQATGSRSFDIGCFQINHRWHGEHFASVDAMFDPLENALYAAGFLSDLHRELGDWTKAAGAYHSRTEVYAARYRRRFSAIRAALPEGGPIAVGGDRPPTRLARAQAEPRVNTYPLLRGSTSGALGSLVPIESGG
ncbi:MAG: transglycosylase SLT domain-containing protein [Rhodobacteraceae bacterium]|nr:transglycosylase SLT domain-containing protein [Paracoccaceae bacterium]